MQLSGIALRISTIIIVYAISNIGALLNLGYQYSLTNSMNTACRKEEHIAAFHFMKLQYVGNRIIFDSLYILCGSYLLRKSRIEACSRFSVDDIPHLGFPE